MSTQLGEDQHTGAADRRITPAHSRRDADNPQRAAQMVPDPDGTYRRPRCLLALAIREVGETADMLRLSRAVGNDALGERVKWEQEGWHWLYEFTCQRICPALRVEAVEPEAATVLADAALAAMPATVPGDILTNLRGRLAVCAAYRDANDCPFLNPPPEDAAL